MTNLEYVRTLNSQELANFIYQVILPEGKNWTSSRDGIALWLDKEKVSVDDTWIVKS